METFFTEKQINLILVLVLLISNKVNLYTLSLFLQLKNDSWHTVGT